LPVSKFKGILNAAVDSGFKEFKFSGGEPLLRKADFISMVKFLQGRGISKISVTTNGTTLKQDATDLKKLKLCRVRVSLDTIEAKTFAKITGSDCLGNVLAGIEEAVKQSIPLRINAVVTQENYGGIFDLIDYCSERKIDIKLFDLNWFKEQKAGYWDRNFQSLTNITKNLRKISSGERMVYADGGYGIPMKEFDVKGIRVRLKDSLLGTTYSSFCKGCPLLPNGRQHFCQEGLYNLFLTSDGRLKICRHRNDIAVDASAPEAFERIKVYYKKSKFRGKLGG